jgi:hypothetical protein
MRESANRDLSRSRYRMVSLRNRLQQPKGASADWQLLIFVLSAGFVAYCCCGFIGIGLVGLSVLFVALQLDIDHAAPTCCFIEVQPGLRVIRRSTDPVESVNGREELSRLFWSAKMLGFGLAVIGIGGLVI